jgi:hypothetical protein
MRKKIEILFVVQDRIAPKPTKPFLSPNMEIYPQKWHLPDFPIPNPEFRRVNFNDLSEGKYYYVQIIDNRPPEPPRKKGGKPKARKAPCEYVGKLVEFISLGDDRYSKADKPKVEDCYGLEFKALYKRPWPKNSEKSAAGKTAWTSIPEHDEMKLVDAKYFYREGVDATDEDREKDLATVFYDRWFPPGAFRLPDGRATEPSYEPGSYLFDLKQFNELRREGRPTWAFTSKQPKCPWKKVPLSAEELAIRAKVRVQLEAAGWTFD